MRESYTSPANVNGSFATIAAPGAEGPVRLADFLDDQSLQANNRPGGMSEEEEVQM